MKFLIGCGIVLCLFASILQGQTQEEMYRQNKAEFQSESIEYQEFLSHLEIPNDDERYHIVKYNMLVHLSESLYYPQCLRQLNIQLEYIIILIEHRRRGYGVKADYIERHMPSTMTCQ